MPTRPDYYELQELLARFRLQYDVPDDMWTRLMLDSTPPVIQRPLDLDRFRDLGTFDPGMYQ